MALQSGGVVLGFGNEVHVCLKIFSRNFVFRTAWQKIEISRDQAGGPNKREVFF